jgi:putative lipoic acid-binding regulatory protein
MDYREDEDKFKELLNKEYSWPASYTFKFILPTGKEKAIEDLFKKDVEIKTKPSSGGKYTSITIYARMSNADEILKLYKQASTITGIISL